MSEISPVKKWERVKLIQTFTSGAAGLLVAADVMNMRVPLYFLGQATDRVGDVFHAVTRLVGHSLPDILDQFQRNAIAVSDALYLALTAVLIGAGFVFLRNAWRALAKMRPGHWVPLPGLGWRRMILAVLALGGGMALVWQYGDLPWLAGRLVRSLWLAVAAAYENRDAVRQTVLAIHENSEAIAQVAKGIVSAVATYVTLEVAAVAVNFALSIIRLASPVVLPIARYGYAGYKYSRQWLPHVELTQRQIDWLHIAGSVTAGSLFGFENLSFPSIPTWLWAASLPGLFLFARERPNLVTRIWRMGCCVGRCLNYYVSIATVYTRAHPREALRVAAGAMVGVAGVGAIHAYSPLLAVAIILGTLKAGYSAATIALMVAAVRGSAKIVANVRQAGGAVARRGTATRQRLIAASHGLTASGANLANAARGLASRARSRLPARENTSGYSLISAR